MKADAQLRSASLLQSGNRTPRVILLSLGLNLHSQTELVSFSSTIPGLTERVEKQQLERDYFTTC
ncbi:MAG TPA: hypothetical protein DEG17_07460 [Cyanobacteria bacterium UBA11149]|nr:hypothetical protein [Cyanobacteria bacterium UBA11367]HBE56276.1 hypothetical protein [Cyanobacteria bacterium UBA11366]HBK65056.1 hypothetical protein [Cyanobacteria bacterium UBA11166]HBR75993.1 hypothetical protein [Cyanobacteria bacterium UBA11159]HBS72618.1 hypothetical protein [Cyanobacteria bacterium UBA11153]HBW88701.1 hypothetical protein [Cyanobacteria bacterium UBA11149]HCA96774.1 hypothetical protein [Cyanobacteria bacterium UBA9226]